jgi:predicted ATP-grasp superfamily ATP-dependent carboligase
MVATYTDISIGQMREVLRRDKGWREVELDNVREYVFDWPIKSEGEDTGCVVRVYTSISKWGNHSRGCGADAIRVCAVNLRTGKGLKKAKRVNRTDGWQDRLKDRVLAVVENIRGRYQQGWV